MTDYYTSAIYCASCHLLIDPDVELTTEESPTEKQVTTVLYDKLSSAGKYGRLVIFLLVHKSNSCSWYAGRATRIQPVLQIFCVILLCSGRYMLCCLSALYEHSNLIEDSLVSY